MSKYPKIEVTKEELIRTIYFILMKYNSDSLHLQGTSSKRDLIGGFIERWLNKLAETVVFDVLFKDKPYSVIPDYFLYNNSSEKNAPDVIGIKDKRRIIPFVQYNDGKWETIKKRPRVEVKVFRKGQYLMGVRQPQMIDDFYVFVESDLSPDYLTTIFDKEVFNPKNLDLLKINPIFIKSDKNSNIINPEEPHPAKTIGSFRLIGTYTKNQILEHTISCKPKVSPWYVKSVSNVNKVVRAGKSKPIRVENKKFTYNFRDSKFLPIAIEGNLKEVTIIKQNKGSFYLKTPRSISINGKKVSPGYVRVELSEFKRSSSWNENLAIKNSFEIFAKDSTNKMIKEFDKFYKTEK